MHHLVQHFACTFLPVSGVDPAGALVNVVNVIDFAIKVSGFLPTLR